MEAIKQFHFSASHKGKKWSMQANSLGTINKVGEALEALGIETKIVDTIEERIQAEVAVRLAQADGARVTSA